MTGFSQELVDRIDDLKHKFTSLEDKKLIDDVITFLSTVTPEQQETAMNLFERLYEEAYNEGYIDG